MPQHPILKDAEKKLQGSCKSIWIITFMVRMVVYYTLIYNILTQLLYSCILNNCSTENYRRVCLQVLLVTTGIIPDSGRVRDHKAHLTTAGYACTKGADKNDPV